MVGYQSVELSLARTAKPPVLTADTTKRPVKSILISQPKPEGKSPYLELAERHRLKIDFRPFIQVDPIEGKDFRKSKVHISEYSAVIFNSRHAIDHFFRICDEMRVKLSPETKFFCDSEAVALYLQKYTQYRKRKVFFGKGNIQSLLDLLLKHKDKESFLFPCSDIRAPEIPDFLTKHNFKFAEAVIYRTVAADLSDLEEIFYDMIVFFSPAGVKSLFVNFPGFKQNFTRIAAFGSSTKNAVLEMGLHLDVEAPVLPDVPSMTLAIERYLREVNK